MVQLCFIEFYLVPVWLMNVQWKVLTHTGYKAYFKVIFFVPHVLKFRVIKRSPSSTMLWSYNTEIMQGNAILSNTSKSNWTTVVISVELNSTYWLKIYFTLLDSPFPLDRNECIENPGICNPGQCIDTLGSYRCHCPNGFKTTRDQSMCVGKQRCRRPQLQEWC